MAGKVSGKGKKKKQVGAAVKNDNTKNVRRGRSESINGMRPKVEKAALAIMLVLIALLLLVPPFQRGIFFPRELLLANIAIFGLLIVWGIFRLFRNEKKVIGSPLDICLLVLLFAYVVSFFGAAHQRDALEETLKIASYLVVYVVTVDICRYFKFSLYKPNLRANIDQAYKNPDHNLRPGIHIVLHIFLIAATVVTLASLGAASGFLEFPGAYVINRISSPMGYANTAAAYMMAAYLFTLALAPLYSKWQKVFYLAPAVLMLLTVILTFSRGAWLLLAPLSLLLVLVTAPGERLRSVCYLLVTGAVAVPGAFLVDPFFREDQPFQAWLLIAAVVVMVVLLGLLAELYLSQSRRLRISFAGAGAAVIILAVMITIVIPAVGPVHLERTAQEPDEHQNVEQHLENITPGESYQLTLEVNAEKAVLPGTEDPDYVWGLRVVGSSPEEDSVRLVNHRGDTTEGWEEKTFTFRTDEKMSRLEVQIFNRYSGTSVTARDVILSAAGEEEKLDFFLHRALPERLYNRIISGSLDRNIDRRVELYGDAVKIIRDYPVTGTGGGGWNALYRSYQDQPYSSREVHNHYLQVWVEAGLLGFLAFTGIWISFAAAFIRNCIKQRTSHRAWQFWAASFIPVAALGAHSIIDWNFSMAAVGIVLFVLLGAGRSLDDSNWFGRFQGESEGGGKRASYVGIAGIIVGSLLFIFTIMLLYGLDATGRSQELMERSNVGEAKEEMQKAMQADPFRSDNYHNLSVIIENRAHQTGSPADIEKMISLAERAYELEPYDPQYVVRYGSLLIRHVEIEKGIGIIDRITDLRPFRESSYLEPASIRLQIAEFYLENNNRLLAERFLNEILELEQVMKENYGDSEPLAFFLGRAHYLLGDFRSAAHYYEKVEEKDDYYDEAQSDLEEIRTEE